MNDPEISRDDTSKSLLDLPSPSEYFTLRDIARLEVFRVIDILNNWIDFRISNLSNEALTRVSSELLSHVRFKVQPDPKIIPSLGLYQNVLQSHPLHKALSREGVRRDMESEKKEEEKMKRVNIKVHDLKAINKKSFPKFKGQT